MMKYAGDATANKRKGSRIMRRVVIDLYQLVLFLPAATRTRRSAFLPGVAVASLPYWRSNTITTGGLEPRNDSSVMVLPSVERARVSVRVTVVPAMAPSVFQVVTSLSPAQRLVVSAFSPMKVSLETGFPVRS